MELAGTMIGVVGRFATAPRSRIIDEVARRGGAVTRRLSAASFLVVAHGAHRLIASGRLAALLERAGSRGLACLSERMFLRRLGLVGPLPPGARDLTPADLARCSGLDEGWVALLAALDILEAEDGRFAFGDLILAREIGRLRRDRVPLAAIAAAAMAVRRHAGGATLLTRGRMDRLATGELVLRIGASLCEAGGQIRLPLAEGRNPSLDQLFTAAESAEEEGAFEEAERLYGRVLRIAPDDPIAWFNLANSLSALGRGKEAKLLLQRAVGLDPGFAEAWYNLAHIAEGEGRHDAARRHLERAVAIDDCYADAIYNLARLWLLADAHAAAAELFERYLRLDARSSWAARARHALTLCRLMAKRSA